MNNYFVRVHSFMPYKVENQSTESGSNFAPAIRKGIAKFRKSLGKKRKIRELTVYVAKLK